MNIVVLDGMGGGIGSRIVGILKDEIPPYIEVYGLGTNALATAAMLKKGANKGATGENAIAVTVKKADFIIGSIAMTLFPDFFSRLKYSIPCSSVLLQAILRVLSGFIPHSTTT